MKHIQTIAFIISFLISFLVSMSIWGQDSSYNKETRYLIAEWLNENQSYQEYKFNQLTKKIDKLSDELTKANKRISELDSLIIHQETQKPEANDVINHQPKPEKHWTLAEVGLLFCGLALAGAIILLVILYITYIWIFKTF